MEREFIQRQVEDMDRRLHDIEKTLGGRDALVQERDRLRAARAALTGEGSPASPTDGGAAARTPRRRAPRGENKGRLLEALQQRPGASVAELAQVSGVSQPTASSTLRQMAERGEAERVDLGGGKMGYRLGQPRESTQEQAAAG